MVLICMLLKYVFVNMSCDTLIANKLKTSRRPKNVNFLAAVQFSFLFLLFFCPLLSFTSFSCLQHMGPFKYLSLFLYPCTNLSLSHCHESSMWQRGSDGIVGCFFLMQCRNICLPCLLLLVYANIICRELLYITLYSISCSLHYLHNLQLAKRFQLLAYFCM